MINPQSSLPLFNAIASAGKTIYEIAQGTAKLEEKQRLLDVYNSLMELKREASELEDQNHDLKQKLRFKSNEFEFKNPFWYEKINPDRALCPKCFSKEIVAPVGEYQQGSSGAWRNCLACDTRIEETPTRRSNPGPFSGARSGPNGWMT